MKRFIEGFAVKFTLISILVMAAGLFVAAGRSAAVEEDLPVDPLKGRIPFEQKLCIKCHAIGGAGGRVGPDLAEVRFKGSFLNLASLLWNHIPDMVVEYKNLNLHWPEFTDDDVSSLVSYLYYLRYLGEPGDLGRGEKLLGNKGCLHCHSVGKRRGNNVGPRLDSLKRYASPIYMVQAIWNHGPRMQEKMNEMGIERPKFSGRDISDISAYIRSVSSWKAKEKIYLSPGNPNDGRQVFKNKGCSTCHAVRGKGGGIAPDLDRFDLNLGVTEIASLMWNHGDKMWSTMKHEKITWPTFTGKEMADLLAYLYFIKFVDEPGDMAKGRDVFASKCMACHSIEGKGGNIGSDLTGAPYLDSDISILRAMINNSVPMSETALDMGTMWPMLSGREMRDLFAYLKSAKKKEPESE